MLQRAWAILPEDRPTAEELLRDFDEVVAPAIETMRAEMERRKSMPQSEARACGADGEIGKFLASVGLHVKYAERLEAHGFNEVSPIRRS